MNRLLLILCLFFQYPTFAQQTFRIAFGSCSHETSEEQLWKEVINTKPDVWIWGGDNVYGDTHNMDVLAQKYNHQKHNTDYQQLLKTCPVTGTWDDHDYGINDGGKYFTQREQSKKLAADFLGFTEQHPVWRHEGIYNSTSVSKAGREIKIINLDTRYFRDTINRVYYVDSISNKRTYKFEMNATGDVLGEAQWRWFEEELKTSNAALYIINSSIQVLSEEHRFEKWMNLPTAHARLLALIQRYPHKKMVIISGDGHIAEISKRSLANLPYPLLDITASGLTHTWSESWEEANRFREGELIIEKNFGLMEVMITNNIVDITISILGKDGQLFKKYAAQL